MNIKLKRYLTLILSFTLIFSCIQGEVYSVSAENLPRQNLPSYPDEEYTVNGSEYGVPFIYTVRKDGTVKLVTYLGSNGNKIAFPDTVEGYPVTEISPQIFSPYKLPVGGYELNDPVGGYDERTVNFISIPRYLEKLDRGFLNTLVNLEHITVHDESPYFSESEGVLFSKNRSTLIRYPRGKKNITYTVPECVVKIEDGAFSGVASLANLIIGSNVTEIGYNIFSDNDSFLSPSNQQFILFAERGSAAEMFALSNGIMCSVTEPKATTAISDGVPSVTNMTTDIGMTATTATNGTISTTQTTTTQTTVTTATTTVAPPEALIYSYEIRQYKVYIMKYIGNDVNVTVPETIGGYPVVSVEEFAFAFNLTLRSVTLPDTAETVGIRAFSGCKLLEKVTLGRGIYSIGKNAFEDCPALREISVHSSNKSYMNIGAALFNKDRTELLKYCPNNAEMGYAVPDGVLRIAEKSFYGAYTLVNVTLPESVTGIGEEAFGNCTSLTSIVIPNGNAAVGYGAFGSARTLKLYSAGGAFVEKYAAENGIVFIPAKMKIIASDSDFDYAVYDGKSVIKKYIGATGVTVVVPKSLGGYPVVAIGEYAFAGCNILNIELPEGIESINYGAFESSSLISITIPSTVTDIGESAFAYCEDLISLDVSKSQTDVGQNAFIGCDNLTDVSAGDNKITLPSIDGAAFISPVEIVPQKISTASVGIPLEMILLCIILCVLSVLFYKLKLIRSGEKGKIEDWAVVILIPASALYLIITIGNTSGLTSILIAAAVFLVSMTLFHLFKSLVASKQEKVSAAVFEQEKSYYYNQCKTMEQNAETVKQFRHDAKNHLLAIADFIKSGNAQEAEEYIYSIVGEKLSTDTSFSKTGNLAVDSVLNFKLAVAAKEDIAVDADINVPSDLKIDPSDFTAVAGNLIDNAVNALKTLPPSQRRLSLRVRYDRGRLFIETDNTFDGNASTRNGRFITRNKDKQNHGYGLKNIGRTVKKYDGFIRCDFDDSLFRVFIMMYIE